MATMAAPVRSISVSHRENPNNCGTDYVLVNPRAGTRSQREQWQGWWCEKTTGNNYPCD